VCICMEEMCNDECNACNNYRKCGFGGGLDFKWGQSELNVTSLLRSALANP